MDIKIAFILSVVLCVLFTALFIFVRSKGASPKSLIAKTVASFCFVLCCLISLTYSGIINGAYMCIIAGLVCGLIGDILLEAKVIYVQDSDIYLNEGFGSFACGHVFYIFALIDMATNCGIDCIMPILVAIGGGLLLTIGSYFSSTKLLKQDFGKHKIATIAYTFILTGITVFAIVLAIMNTMFISFAIGLIFFLVSDLILSMQYFGGKANNNTLQILNHSTYYLAQILIASTVFIQLL
ncbi:MAG: lysoplasmalogenase [Clostridia bacterium]|nr:lysoplasmalogenase [Clostridia bacterium]